MPIQFNFNLAEACEENDGMALALLNSSWKDDMKRGCMLRYAAQMNNIDNQRHWPTKSKLCHDKKSVLFVCLISWWTENKLEINPTS